MGKSKRKKRGGKRRRGRSSGGGNKHGSGGGQGGLALGRDGEEGGSAAAAAAAAVHAATGGLLRRNAGLVSRLRSVKQSDRESACLAIAHLFSSENRGVAVVAARELLRDGLMRALVPRLGDPSPAVRLHASGALRNLTSFSDPEISEKLVQDDAVTPVLGSLRALSVSITAALANGARRNKSSSGGSDSKAAAAGAALGIAPPPSSAVDETTWIFAEQVLAVLINLCEDSEIATRDVSAPQNLEVLLDWVFRSSLVIPDRIRIPAARLLHIVSEQNAPLAQLVLSHQGLPERILALAAHCVQQAAAVVTATTSAADTTPWSVVLSLLGFLINICCTVGRAQAIGQIASVLPGVLKCVLAQAGEDPLRQQAAVAGEELLYHGGPRDRQQEERIVDRHARNKILGLEVFTNLLLTFAEGGEDEDDDDDEDAGRAYDSAGAAGARTGASWKAQIHQHLSQLVTDQDLVAAVARTAGVQIDAAAASASAAAAPAASSSTSSSSSSAVAVRLRARGMNCLGAVCGFLGAGTALVQVAAVCWPSLFSLMGPAMERVRAHAAANDEEMALLHGDMLEATLGAAAALMRAAGATGMPLPFQESHAQVVRAVVAASGGFPPSCRSQALALVGVAGKLPHDSASHARLSQVCLDVLCNDPSLLVVARGLDIVFDLYCEDDAFRDVWERLRVMEQLRSLAPLFRKRWKTDRALVHEGEGAVIAEALHNFSRFIDYKKGTGW